MSSIKTDSAPDPRTPRKILGPQVQPTVAHFQASGVLKTSNIMSISLASIVTALPSDETWGPPTTTDALVDGVPYAPYSKGDKLGRMADWTSEGKDGRDGRGGRQQYNRNYRGY